MSNANPTFSLEIDSDLAPQIRDALSIAACTSMMCSEPASDKALRQLMARVEEAIPPVSLLFDTPAKWSELALTLRAGNHNVRVENEPSQWFSTSKKTIVTLSPVDLNIKGARVVSFEAYIGTKIVDRRALAEDSPEMVLLIQNLERLLPIDRTLETGFDSQAENQPRMR